MSSFAPKGNRSDVDAGEEVTCAIVLADGDGATPLELAEEVFDEAPRLMEFSIEGAWRWSIGLGRDDRDITGCAQGLAHRRAGIESLVANNASVSAALADPI